MFLCYTSQNHCYSIRNFLILEIFIKQWVLGLFSCQFNDVIELRLYKVSVQSFCTKKHRSLVTYSSYLFRCMFSCFLPFPSRSDNISKELSTRRYPQWWITLGKSAWSSFQVFWVWLSVSLLHTRFMRCAYKPHWTFNLSHLFNKVEPHEVAMCSHVCCKSHGCAITQRSCPVSISTPDPSRGREFMAQFL